MVNANPLALVIDKITPPLFMNSKETNGLKFYTDKQNV